MARFAPGSRDRSLADATRRARLGRGCLPGWLAGPHAGHGVVAASSLPPTVGSDRRIAEVAAAGGRIAPAARTLGITPSAVSHLMRELERGMGQPLLAGRGAPERLTEVGGRLAGGFAAIDAAVAEARRRRGAGEVRVSTWRPSRGTVNLAGLGGLTSVG